MGATNGLVLHSDDRTRMVGGSPFCPKVDQCPRAARSLGVRLSAMPFKRRDDQRAPWNSRLSCHLRIAIGVGNQDVMKIITISDNTEVKTARDLD